MKVSNDNQTHHPIPPHVTQVILESISDGVFTVDHQWHVTSFNCAAEKITGIPREKAIGKHCWEVFRSNMCERNCALNRTMEQGKAFVDTSTYIVDSQKRRIPIVVCTSLLKDENGNILGGVETFRDMSQVEELRKELEGRYQVGDMVSRSAAMDKIFRIMPQVAESDATVLIQGETGTGKELLAKAIHDLSPRRKKPFIAINCGALPDTLLESELFGYKAGAFTDANKDKPGHFALAEGGTVLLDEIGDLSEAFQVRLLRILQEKTYQPLGGTKTITADIRIITATNSNLKELVRKGKFRRDLFYRINVVRLDLPALRERKEDIPMLINHFILRLNRLRGKSIAGINQEALSRLMAHHYPGNIRELENIIERAFVLCPEGQIEAHCLPDHLTDSISTPIAEKDMASAKQSAEIKVILDTLKRNQYNRLEAARELGIHKSTLYRKIKKLGIPKSPIDGRSRDKQ